MHPLLQKVRPKVVARQSVTLLLLGVAMLSLPFVRHALAATTHPDPAQVDAEQNAEPREPLERSAAIEAELKRSPGHAWAGEYYEGDGLGANIRMQISPVAGVAVTWHGCLGLYDANEGNIKVLPDGILKLEFAHIDDGRPTGFPDRLMPVRWGERRYLIPPSAMPDFVAAINQGNEPRADSHGRFLMAEGDELKNVDGLPGLPAEHLGAIRTRSLHAGFIASRQLPDEPGYGEMCTKRYEVDIKVVEGGEPVRPGDIFMTEVPRNTSADLSVVSVDGNRASGVIEVFELDCQHPDSVPDRRWKFATGAYDLAAANRRIDEGRADALSRR
jgi:hypothetical protein